MIWNCSRMAAAVVLAVMSYLRDAVRSGTEAQEKLDAQEYEATSGGGMVAVKVSGKRELLSITIDPQVVDPDDVEMLQDLVMAAVNEALRKGEETREATMNRLAPGMGGMGGLF